VAVGTSAGVAPQADKKRAAVRVMAAARLLQLLLFSFFVRRGVGADVKGFISKISGVRRAGHNRHLSAQDDAKQITRGIITSACFATNDETLSVCQLARKFPKYD
jgi:hypothetical protein